MDITLFQQLFTQGGISLVVVFVAYKIVVKLYDDTRADSERREKMLMDYLDEKNETDRRIADTLEDISEKLQSMNTRLCEVEKKIEC